MVPEESSQYAESNELKFIHFKQTFITTKFGIKKSYQISCVVKRVFLDWTSYAITVGVSGSQAEDFPHIWSNLRYLLSFFLEF